MISDPCHLTKDDLRGLFGKKPRTVATSQNRSHSATSPAQKQGSTVRKGKRGQPTTQETTTQNPPKTQKKKTQQFRVPEIEHELAREEAAQGVSSPGEVAPPPEAAPELPIAQESAAIAEASALAATAAVAAAAEGAAAVVLPPTRVQPKRKKKVDAAVASNVRT